MEAILENDVEVGVVGIGVMGGGIAKQLRKDAHNNLTEVREGDDQSVLEGLDIIFWAVKPDQWSAAAKAAVGHVASHAVSVSIMAGIPEARIHEDLGDEEGELAVVRAMMTAAVDGNTLTALYARKDSLTVEQKLRVERVVAQLGEFAWVSSEAQITKFTGLVGSGAGFFAQLTEVIRQLAVSDGFDEGLALKMAKTAMRGGTRLIDAGLTPAQAVDAVAGKKRLGTTAAGLEVMERHHRLHRLMRAVMNAAYKRSDQLAKF